MSFNPLCFTESARNHFSRDFVTRVTFELCHLRLVVLSVCLSASRWDVGWRLPSCHGAKRAQRNHQATVITA